jgi:DtxR family Mn-dependent transcriptional regulator
MRTSLREDYLEAILIHTGRYSHPPCVQDIIEALHIDERDVRSHLEELAHLGDICLRNDGRILLTDQGTATGKQIIKKHEILQSFLSEILGMDSSSASDEACRIEHAVSDETIDRLDDYLRSPVIQSRCGGHTDTDHDCIRWAQRRISCGNAHVLGDFDEGERLIVRNIHGRTCSKRLLDLGVVPGQRVLIKRKLRNGSIVVQVKDCDVALSPEIASAICVERMP